MDNEFAFAINAMVYFKFFIRDVASELVRCSGFDCNI